MADLRMFFYHFYPLTQWTMTCHNFDPFHSDETPKLVLFNYCRLTNVSSTQYENKHFELVANRHNRPFSHCYLPLQSLFNWKIDKAVFENEGADCLLVTLVNT